MSPLRMRMIEDMKLAGLSPGTQATYIDAVRKLAAYYRRSPDQLSEEEVRAYILNLRERGAARGTFKANYYGIRYLYRYTLNRDWALFSKKHPPAAAEAFAPRACRRRGPPAAWLHNELCFAVMYACGLRIGEAATLEIGTIDGDNGCFALSVRATKSGSFRCPNRCF
jgi:site-specific recombinase XerD